MRSARWILAFVLGVTLTPLAPASPDSIQPRTASIKVACIGDSITAGFGIPKDRLTYPQLLAEKLGPRYEVGNFGASGRALLKSSNAPYFKTKEWSAAQAFGPDIVVVILGTNDSKPKNFLRIEEFSADASELIRILKSLPSRPRVCLALPPPVYKEAFTINEPNMEAIRELLRIVASQQHVSLIDLASAMSGKPRLFPDGVHPNADGVQVLADTVFTAITTP